MGDVPSHVIRRFLSDGWQSVSVIDGDEGFSPFVDSRMVEELWCDCGWTFDFLLLGLATSSRPE